MKIIDIVNGSLLGDASIRSDKGKYFTFQVVGKDERFLEWLAKFFNMSRINCWISKNNYNSNVFSLGFYINSSPFKNLIYFRDIWYKQMCGKTVKTIPLDLKIAPTTLLFWYLGDGCLVRRKKDENRVPTIVLATNCFSKTDISILVEKLKKLGLNFYPVEYRSGFTGKKCGYCLYSKTEDGTPFRFFQLIGFECPSEIADCSTGKKGIYHEEKFFRNKWPTEEDWIKILSSVDGVNKIIGKKRKELNLSKRKSAKLIGISREHFRDFELGKHKVSVKNFRRILKVLNLDVYKLIPKIEYTDLN